MPIIGLTDRTASFPRIGELRKGAEKPKTGNRPGADLKYFRFTSKNDEALESFNRAYPSEPNAINVFLPFNTTDENFEAWQEEWGAGSLKHRCDGKTAVRWQTPQGTYSHDPIPCPGGCKQVGRLKVIIPELGRLAYVVVLTTSIHDIMEIHANLSAYEALRDGLQGIPFILSRVPRMISTPSGKDGKRARREKWLIHIEAAPAWVNAQLSVMQRKALPSAIDHETGEIVEPLQIDSGVKWEELPSESIKEPVINIAPEPDKKTAVTDDQRKPTAAMMKALHAAGNGFYGDEWDTQRAILVKAVTKGRVNHSKFLTFAECKKLIDGINKKANA